MGDERNHPWIEDLVLVRDMVDNWQPGRADVLLIRVKGFLTRLEADNIALTGEVAALRAERAAALAVQYERYEMQFQVAENGVTTYSDPFAVVARSQAEAEAYAMATIAPTKAYAQAITGLWVVDSEPIHVAMPQAAALLAAATAPPAPVGQGEEGA